MMLIYKKKYYSELQNNNTSKTIFVMSIPMTTVSIVTVAQQPDAVRFVLAPDDPSPPPLLLP